ncbi:MAG: hypothetical protein AAGH15_26520 [Myxococcota bacterium]
MRALFLLVLLAACTTDAPGDPAGAATEDAGLPALPPTDSLDLLFVVDASAPMEDEQNGLAATLPRLVRSLLTGRRADGTLFGAVRSLHVGVVTADLGAGGHAMPTCEGRFGDDAQLRTTSRTGAAGCDARYPSFLAVEGPSAADADALAADLSCVLRAGTDGCRFVQPLEAMLKALTPASSPLRFDADTAGQGEGGANDGFLRDDAALAVVVLTHADDCSSREPDLFGPGRYPIRDPRCHLFPDALHPVARYVDGLLALEAPQHVAVAVIAGLPTALAPAPGAPADFDGMLADPAMEERIDPHLGHRLVPSCNVPGMGVSFPPRRLVRFAQALEARGADATVQSLCQRDISIAVEDALHRIAGALRG